MIYAMSSPKLSYLTMQDFQTSLPLAQSLDKNSGSAIHVDESLDIIKDLEAADLEQPEGEETIRQCVRHLVCWGAGAYQRKWSRKLRLWRRVHGKQSIVTEYLDLEAFHHL